MAIRKSTFAIDIAKFAEKTNKNMRLLVRRIVIDVFGRVIFKTPVGNPTIWKPLPSGKPRKPPPGYVGGRLRGNWQASVGIPAMGELPLRGEAEATGAAAATATAWNGEGSIFLVNNLPYAEAVEDGHSTQTPAGMVRVTLVEYPGIVERRRREVSR